ncbi:MAG: Na+/H+ antiporter [Candidatus Obscuribacterales bacterium]|nr:Na+/H+ antiporter [Cyanobacteria bacterium HKST-UBA01]MCB9468090.1 Na+/H+ antiporter [Candidatus Obscuribacterales bacterium]
MPEVNTALNTAHGIEILMVLLMVASAVGFALKWVRLPYSVALVIVGLLIGSSHLFPRVEMTPELILFVCLPALLFEASWNIRLNELKKIWKPVSAFATVGVVISMFITGAILAHFCGLPWQAALLFGSMTAATDPISVLALFRKLGLEKRLSLMLEGESLFNDGTAVVLFKMILLMTITGNTLNAFGSVYEFVRVVVIGAIVGLCVGAFGSRVTRYFDDHLLEITLTTIVAYGSYLVAEQLHSSAVIAVVVAGVVVGNYGSRTGMSATTRLAVNSFWEYAAFVTNSLVFLLIGLQINLNLLMSHAYEIGVAIVAIMISRIVVVYGLSFFVSDRRHPIPYSWRHLLFWGALRGSLSMALALSLPHDFAMRENIVVLTFGVVLFTLLIPGLTIEPLVRILGMASDDKRLREYFTLKSRLYAESNALKDLEHQFTSGIVTRGIYLRIRDEILSKQRELSHRMEEMKLEHSIIESIQEGETRKRLLESRKDSLLRLLREEAGDPDIVEELVMEVDKDLDQIVSDERKIEEQLRRDSKKPSSGFLTLKMKKHEKDESDQSEESKETQEAEIETKQEKH